MTHKKGDKLEPPLRLDMSFTEALGRFTATDPKEVEGTVARSKKRKPPGATPPGGLEFMSEGDPVEGRQRKPSSGR